MEDLELIVESIARLMSTRPLNEQEITVDSLNSIYVFTYDAGRPEDKAYIGLHKNEIWEFMNDGYVAAGLDKFKGCYNAKSVKNNASILRVATRKDDYKPLAMSVYTKYLGGNKCVGITRRFGDNPQLTELARIALKHIIKMDISQFREYVWIECDGAIKHYWEKFGGTKIPNSYLPCIFPEDVLSRITVTDGEDYDYDRVIGRGEDAETVRKCVFGFNKPDVLEKYILEHDTSVDEMMEEIRRKQQLDESASDEYMEAVVRLYFLQHYTVSIIEDGTRTVTEHELGLIRESYDILKPYYDRYGHMLNSYPCEMMTVVLNNTADLLNTYTLLKPYTLDDYLECAELDVREPETASVPARLEL